MKIRRIICFAAALCLLWSAAAADAGSSGSYGPPAVDLHSRGLYPYTYSVQLEEDELSQIPYLLDGIRSTGYQHVCTNSLSLDEIPEITFYFSGASLRELWFRNGWENYMYPYTYHARVMLMDVVVWSGHQSYGPYRITLQDTNDTSAFNRNMIEGYQRYSLPKKFSNVTKVDLYIKGWYPGENRKFVAYLSDMVFLPDTVEALFGSWIDDYDYSGDSGSSYDYDYYYTPTPRPTSAPVPTVTPRPRVTPVPETGVRVQTAGLLAARSGPGSHFTDLDLGARIQTGAWVKAISSATDRRNGGTWIQIEVTGSNGELRRGYVEMQQLKMYASQVPAEEGMGGGTLIRSVWGYFGPGYGYSMYSEQIPAGTSGIIWREEGLYALLEYYDENVNMTRRVWVPLGALDMSANG